MCGSIIKASRLISSPCTLSADFQRGEIIFYFHALVEFALSTRLNWISGFFLQESHVGGLGRGSLRLPNGYILPEGKVTPNALFVGGIDLNVRFVETADMLYSIKQWRVKLNIPCMKTRSIYSLIALTLYNRKNNLEFGPLVCLQIIRRSVSFC